MGVVVTASRSARGEPDAVSLSHLAMQVAPEKGNVFPLIPQLTLSWSFKAGGVDPKG